MIKKITSLIRKVIFAVFFIYGFNKLCLPLDVIIPMNVITIFLVSVFGIPSIFMLVLFSLVCL